MQALNVKVRGLYTHPNPFSDAPPGSLLKAKNMVMDKEGIIESRRGFKRYGNALSLGAGEKINSLFNYKDTLLVHYGTTLAYDGGSGAWSGYSGTFSAPSGASKMRSLESNKNFYFSTSAGIKKLDSVVGTVGSAGGFKGLNATATLSGSSGFLTDQYFVAYRIVWGIQDANNNLILGAPSERIIIQNTAGGSATRDVSLAILIPSGITTSHFVQIYRSLMSSAVPNDELGLVYENNPTGGEISAGAMTVVDSTTEALRGATIYTAPSQQGIGQANDAPPLCKDMCFYKNQVLFANTVSKQRKIITMLAVGSPNGVQANDTIVIGGVTYTGKNTESATAGEFAVTTGGTPAENIAATAQSLVNVINKYSSNTLYYAYYISGYNDLPGKILIEERGIGGNSYAFTSSRGGAYNPALPTSGTTISSSSDTSKNRVWASKVGQPEAVPLANYVDIGSADKDIVRIIALRDSVFVFKKDGVFRITGESLSAFQVTLFDVTVVLTAAETAVPFNNQIFAYTSQGVVGVSDTGVSIMSRPIEVDLLPIATFSSFSTISFGIAYNSDRKYMLFNQKISTDTIAKQAWVYNAISNAWTRWEKSFSCGIVNTSDDKLYLGSADSAYVYQERKDFAVSDYADEEVSVTITGSNGTTVSVASTTGISAGWTLVQSGNLSRIVSVNSSTQLTVSDSGLSWQARGGTAYNPISVEIETIQQYASNPGILKHFRDLTIFFRRAQFKSLSIGLKSNVSDYSETTDIAPISAQGFGKFPWGAYGWGGHDLGYRTIRTFIPRNKQRCHWLTVVITHAIAREYFAVAGLSLMYDVMSERTK